MNLREKASVGILTPAIGAPIDGVDLSGPLDDTDVAAIRRLLLARARSGSRYIWVERRSP
jgi:hypothetical protein